MEVKIFQKHYAKSDVIEDFMSILYQKDMMYLASDFLANGVDKDDIKSAVKKALLSIENAGINSKQHFQPVVSVKNGTSFLDCRLSSLGRSLVLLNTEPKSEYVATFQVKVATLILKSNNK